MSKRHAIGLRRASTRGLRGWLLLVALIFCGGASAQVSPNYQGLWWAAPAGVESGWGINFAHQGDQVFATWYTYDTSGKTWWLSMLAARTNGGNVYAGKINVDHGPPFNNFVGAGVPTEVGSGTLTFVDASNGSFSYTVNGVMQTKAITRFDLGDGPQPACIYSTATPNLAAATNYQDLWWVADGAESGWGINFAQQGDRVYATWYTYDLDGTPLWLTVLASRQGTSNVYTGTLFRSSGPRFDQYDPTQFQTQPVGPATFTFTDGNHATFEYSVMYAPLPGPVHQTKQITRFPFAATGGTICQTIPDPQLRVSAPTPFAPGCEGTPVNGTLYANAEVEPYVAANPVNPSNLIGVWQQDRWSNGGSKGLLTGASFDGGRTWTRSMAAFSRCTGGNAANGADFERASDPWVAIGGDGVAYQIAIGFNGATLAAGSSGAVLASRSVDGGRTWSAPVALIRDGAANFNDKESIAADPFVAGNAYAVWDRLEVSGHGPTYFTRTTNGGVTWELARAIFDPGGTNQTINNQTVVLTDGTLVTFFTRLDNFGSAAASATLVVIRSTDKGVTWSAPITVSGVQAIGARDPETGTPVRDGENLGAIAAGPGGTLVAVWQDSRFSGGVRDGIALSRSIRRRPHLVGAGAGESRSDRRRVRARGDDSQRRHDRRHLFRFPQQHGGRGDAVYRLLARTLERWRHMAREPRRRTVRPRQRAECGRPVPRRLSGAHQHRHGIRAVLRCGQHRRHDQPDRHPRVARDLGRRRGEGRRRAFAHRGGADRRDVPRGNSAAAAGHAGARAPPHRERRAHDDAARAGMAAAGIVATAAGLTERLRPPVAASSDQDRDDGCARRSAALVNRVDTRVPAIENAPSLR